jgi:hypothetical protein
MQMMIRRVRALLSKDITVTGFLTFTEKLADPPNPPEGSYVIWQAEGTGFGDDGDIVFKITAGGVTKLGTLIDFSAVP